MSIRYIIIVTIEDQNAVTYKNNNIIIIYLPIPCT